MQILHCETPAGLENPGGHFLHDTMFIFEAVLYLPFGHFKHATLVFDLKVPASTHADVGYCVGEAVGTWVGEADGAGVGAGVGEAVGEGDGCIVGELVGF
jgi:hypothetical protein